MTAALSGVLANVGGPGYWKRKSLYNGVQSILLYGAPVWYKVTNIQKYRIMLESAQVILGIPPESGGA